jgi:putative nucleotide binding protein
MDKRNNKRKNPPQKTEDNAVILDYLSLGYVQSDMSKFKGKAIAQAIGTDYFTLLELAPKNGVDLEIQDTVYIGKGKRDKIYRVLGKLDFENLTATSRIELEYAIKDIVISREEEFVEFFNTAGPVNTRLHKLELIPGIGKKYMREILDERKKKEFESFEDISNRVSALSDPVGMIANRVKQELDTTTVKRGKLKYYLFTPIPRNNSNRNKR